MKPNRVVWAAIVAALLFGACGDKGGGSGTPERDGPYGSGPGKDGGSSQEPGPGGGGRDSGSDAMDAGMDAGSSMPDGSIKDPTTKRTPKVVSVGPPYGVAEEPYNYSPKSDQAGETTWSVKSGPAGVVVDEKSNDVKWTPTKEQGGKHQVVLEGKSGDKAVTQTYEVTVAVPQKEAQGFAEPKASGQVSVSSPKSDIQGASIYTPKGAVKEPTDLTISKLDKAPPMNNVKGDTKAVKFGPSGTIFQTPALVALPLAESATSDVSRIGAYVYNPEGRWERVPVVRVDLENRLVYARASHFSAYAAAESALALDTSLRPMVSTSACEGKLVGRATLKEGLSSVQTGSINNLPPEKEALFANVAELLKSPETTGSFRFVRVFDLFDGEARVESAIAATTLHLPGDGSAHVTHSDELGNVIGTFSFSSAMDSFAEIESHLRGAYTHVFFRSTLRDSLSLSVALHALYFDEDVSADPVNGDLIGLALVEGSPALGVSDAEAGVDADCDGLSNAVDTRDDRLVPALVVDPVGMVSMVVGQSVRLSAKLENAPEGTAISFQDVSGMGSLSPVQGEPNARDFSASVEGRFLVEARATVLGATLEKVFAIDVVKPAVPPKCTPMANTSSVKLGESVSLKAALGSSDLPDSALSIDWGVVENGAFTSLSLGTAREVSFAPASAGALVLGCRASSGLTSGEVGTTEIGVLEPQQNRAPVDLVMSPSSATISVGEQLSFSASASDPDEGDTLTFTWAASGGTLGAATRAGSTSKSTFSATEPGLYEISVSISDGEAPAETLTGEVLVVENKVAFEQAVDADKDGWPAGAAGTGLDCDDTNARVNPAAKDSCGDQVDDDCNGVVRATDCDDDGVSVAQGDCNDADANIRPDAFEYCDGVDNDCDKLTDENKEGVVLVGTACSVGVGACAATGKLACARDAINTVCTAPVILPKAEICNGIDDNCDGRVPSSETDDDGDGLTECAGDCDDTRKGVRPGTVDVCDAVDNDCDLTMDEDFAPESTSCGVGACAAAGRTSCSNGVVVNSCKEGVPAQSDTTCDGVDDNCNGKADEGYAARETTCGTGACAAQGLTSCVDGKVQDSCLPSAPKGDDLDCNNVDEDCDGVVDDGYVGKPTSCGQGVCAASGVSACVGGKVVDSCKPGDQSGVDDNCNGIDEDCDGIADDGFIGQETSCGTGVCAGAGKTSCIDGKVQDSCVIGKPSGDDVECNGIDEDCDGRADDGYIAKQTSCGAGVCVSSGELSCVSGKVVDTCAALKPTGIDADCNGVDENCNGIADDGYKSEVTACGVGVCVANGATSCVGGRVLDSCKPADPKGLDTTCNNVDEDCDGRVDDEYVSTVSSCGKGVCARSGETSCVDGKLIDSCVEGRATGDDTDCNAVDEDCDGLADDGYVARETTCGIGACGSTGAITCEAGKPVDSCLEKQGAPVDGTCDGVDDDCDGFVDDNAIVFSYEVCNGKDDDCDGVVDQDLDCMAMEPPASCEPKAEVCNTADDDCDGLIDEDNVCSLALQDDSIVGVWWECRDGTCTELVDHGFMFTQFPAAEVGQQAFSLSNDPNLPAAFDPTTHRYCSDGMLDYVLDPVEKTITFRWMENGAPQELIGTLTLSDMRATVTWLTAPADGKLTMELVRIAEHPGGFCPTSGGGGGECAPSEMCGNKLDDNCDGMIDNGCPDVCFQSENCDNGIDDDCDGMIDRNDSQCGAQTCTPGATTTEVCNGKDDNCDGWVDNLDGSCQVEGQLGECAFGHLKCTADNLGTFCESNSKAGIEYCDDGRDSDCDGIGTQDSPTTPEDNEEGCVLLAAGEACFNAIDISKGGTFPVSFDQVIHNEYLGCDNTRGDRVFTFTIPEAMGSAEVRLSVSGGDATAAGQGVNATLAQGSCSAQSAGFSKCFGGSTSEMLNAGKYFVILRGSPEITNASLTFSYRARSPMCDGPCACVPGDGDGDGFTLCDNDCNDQNGTVSPAAVEVCNNVDDDCNGFVDDLGGTCSTGLPGVCTFGELSCGAGVDSCTALYKSGVEYCGDGLDSDCDGDADNNETGCDDTNVAGETCFGAIDLGAGGTFTGELTSANDDVSIRGCSMGGVERVYKFTVPPGRERAFAQIAHGSPDNQVDFTVLRDCASLEVVHCLGAQGSQRVDLDPGTYYLVAEGRSADFWFTLGIESGMECLTPDADEDGFTACNGDCNELDPAINPEGREGSVCDGRDNNCNGQVDDVVGVCNVQGQQGECAKGRLHCPSGCEQLVHAQDSVEVCGDGLDNDCDGMMDDGGEPGFDCTPAGIAGETCGTAIDVSMGGHFAGSLAGALDNAEYACGATSAGAPEQYFMLKLTELHEVHIKVSSANASGESPTAPAGYKGSWPYVLLGAACTNADVISCAASQVHMLEAGTYFIAVQGPSDLKFDLDVWSSAPNGVPGNCLPGDLDADGFTMCDGDCREGNPAVHGGRTDCSGEACTTVPSAPEVCDGLDNNCNGAIDDLPYQVEPQVCETAFTGSCAVGNQQCVQGAMACVANIMPGDELEVCGNDRDDNCDGTADEVTCVAADGETCARALDVSAGGTFPMNLSAAQNDGEGCVPYPNNPELYYTFTLVEQTNVYVRPVVPAGQPVDSFGVSFFTGACVAKPVGQLDGCGNVTYGVQQLLPAGTYTLVVEGSPTVNGALQIAFGDSRLCTPSDGDGDEQTICQWDCNDQDPTVHQGAQELCNNVDDNCDGAVDNLTAAQPCNVAGQLGECSGGVVTCSEGKLGCEPTKTPSTELCGDGKDSDCDGFGSDPSQPEENDCTVVGPGEMCFTALDVSTGGVFSSTLIGAGNDAYGCYYGDSADRYFQYRVEEPGWVQFHVRPVRAPAGVTLSTRLGTSCNPGASQNEYCYSGDINELEVAPGQTLYFMVEASQPVEFEVYVAQTVERGSESICQVDGQPGGDFDGDGFALCPDYARGIQGDCAENDPDVHPTAIEQCDGVDQNCDGAIDNITSEVCSTGLPGICSAGHTACGATGLTCVQNRQAGSEICGDALDNDCNGVTDEAGCEQRPAGDTCELAIDVSNGAALEGETLTGAFDDVSACQQAQVEKLYHLRLDTYAYVSVSAVTVDPTNPVNIAWMQGSCGALSMNGCWDGFIRNAWLAPGDHYFAVEGAANTTYDLYLGIDPGTASCNLEDLDGDGQSICAGDCNEGAPGQNASATEVCNDIDDNCDGLVDNYSGACTIAGQQGECALGTASGCVNGAPSCQQMVTPTTEYCGDGKDTDCDGEGMQTEDPECVPPLPGEICANAIDVSSGGVFFAGPQGTLANRTDDAMFCEDSADPDVFFTFNTDHQVVLYVQPIVVSGGPYTQLETGFFAQGQCGKTTDTCNWQGYATNRWVEPGATPFAVQAPAGTDFDLFVAKWDAGTCTGGPSAPTGDFDGDGHSICNSDCNERDPNVHPGAPELCGDNKDSNCDGALDAAGMNCTVPNLQGLCANGVISCEGRANQEGLCVQQVFPTQEICNNGADDDCDGMADALDQNDCTPICGDGQVGPGETCDDANTIDGDGCSAGCQLEGAQP